MCFTSSNCSSGTARAQTRPCTMYTHTEKAMQMGNDMENGIALRRGHAAFQPSVRVLRPGVVVVLHCLVANPIDF
jgi:hypothetical protein